MSTIITEKYDAYVIIRMVLSEQCEEGRCNQCPVKLPSGELCEHGCKGHLNTANTMKDMNESLSRQIAEEGKTEPITPNEPHVL